MPLYLKYEKWPNVLLMLLYEITYKIIIAYRWIRGSRYDVTLAELLKVLLLTTRFSLGSSKIQKVTIEGIYQKFKKLL